MKTGLKTSLNSLKTWKRIIECVKKYKSYNGIAKRFGVNVDELKHWARSFREAKKRKIISEKEILKKEIENEKLEVSESTNDTCNISSGLVTDDIKLEREQESEDMEVNQLDEENSNQPTRKDENKEETRIHEDIEVHQKNESNTMSVCIVSDKKNSNNGENMKKYVVKHKSAKLLCTLLNKS